VKTDKVDGIICTNWAEWKFISKNKEFWTPTKEQVLQAEEGIEQNLKDNPPRESPNLWRKFSKYKRQYLGITVDGHKRIYCNFYCSGEPLSEHPVFYDDGGDCFFHVQYDVEEQKCYALSINGIG